MKYPSLKEAFLREQEGGSDVSDAIEHIAKAMDEINSATGVLDYAKSKKAFRVRGRLGHVRNELDELVGMLYS